MSEERASTDGETHVRRNTINIRNSWKSSLLKWMEWREYSFDTFKGNRALK